MEGMRDEPGVLLIKQKWVTRQLVRYSYATSGLCHPKPSYPAWAHYVPLPKKHKICNSQEKNKAIGQVTLSGAAPVSAFTVCHVLNAWAL